MRVLVVDDEPKIRAFLEQAFTRKGLTVRSAGSGEEAIELFASDPADVVLLDVRLPDMSGFDVLKRVRDLSPDVRVVMITGLEGDNARQDAEAYGAVKYITKPFDFTNPVWTELFPGVF